MTRSPRAPAVSGSDGRRPSWAVALAQATAAALFLAVAALAWQMAVTQHAWPFGAVFVLAALLAAVAVVPLLAVGIGVLAGRRGSRLTARALLASVVLTPAGAAAAPVGAGIVDRQRSAGQEETERLLEAAMRECAATAVTTGGGAQRGTVPGAVTGDPLVVAVLQCVDGRRADVRARTGWLLACDGGSACGASPPTTWSGRYADLHAETAGYLHEARVAAGRRAPPAGPAQPVPPARVVALR